MLPRGFFRVLSIVLVRVLSRKLSRVLSMGFRWCSPGCSLGGSLGGSLGALDEAQLKEATHKLIKKGHPTWHIHWFISGTIHRISQCVQWGKKGANIALPLGEEAHTATLFEKLL